MAFTMVEVIVALAIMGTTIIAVFGTLHACSKGAQHAKMLTESVLLAETLLIQAVLQENIAMQTTNGGNDTHSWKVRILPTPIESLAVVHVSVQWKEQNRPQQYNLVSALYIKPVLQGK